MNTDNKEINPDQINLEINTLLLENILDKKIISEGFNNSTGWKLKKKILNHLFEPFASIPKNNVLNKKRREVIKKNFENFL